MSAGKLNSYEKKQIGRVFKSLRGISGATILGNGKSALILDIPQIIQYALLREKYFIRQNTDSVLYGRDFNQEVTSL